MSAGAMVPWQVDTGSGPPQLTQPRQVSRYSYYVASEEALADLTPQRTGKAGTSNLGIFSAQEQEQSRTYSHTFPGLFSDPHNRTTSMNTCKFVL